MPKANRPASRRRRSGRRRETRRPGRLPRSVWVAPAAPSALGRPGGPIGPIPPIDEGRRRASRRRSQPAGVQKLEAVPSREAHPIRSPAATRRTGGLIGVHECRRGRKPRHRVEGPDARSAVPAARSRSRSGSGAAACSRASGHRGVEGRCEQQNRAGQRGQGKRGRFLERRAHGNSPWLVFGGPLRSGASFGWLAGCANLASVGRAEHAVGSKREDIAFARSISRRGSRHEGGDWARRTTRGADRGRRIRASRASPAAETKAPPLARAVASAVAARPEVLRPAVRHHNGGWKPSQSDLSRSRSQISYQFESVEINGRSGETRTPDPLSPRQVR